MPCQASQNTIHSSEIQLSYSVQKQQKLTRSRQLTSSITASDIVDTYASQWDIVAKQATSQQVHELHKKNMFSPWHPDQDNLAPQDQTRQAIHH